MPASRPGPEPPTACRPHRPAGCGLRAWRRPAAPAGRPSARSCPPPAHPAPGHAQRPGADIGPAAAATGRRHRCLPARCRPAAPRRDRRAGHASFRIRCARSRASSDHRSAADRCCRVQSEAGPGHHPCAADRRRRRNAGGCSRMRRVPAARCGAVPVLLPARCPRPSNGWAGCSPPRSGMQQSRGCPIGCPAGRRWQAGVLLPARPRTGCGPAGRREEPAGWAGRQALGQGGNPCLSSSRACSCWG